MSNSLKYKLGITEIVSFVVGVLLMMGVARVFFNDYFINSKLICNIVLLSILCIQATLFGTITGGLTGFLGMICSMAISANSIDFSGCIAFGVFGCLLGQFADRYRIREGQYRFKHAALWMLTNLFSLIVAFIFVEPLIGYIFYNRDLIEGVMSGIELSLCFAFPIGISFAFLLFLIGLLFAYVKNAPRVDN